MGGRRRAFHETCEMVDGNDDVDKARWMRTHLDAVKNRNLTEMPCFSSDGWGTLRVMIGRMNNLGIG